MYLAEKKTWKTIEGVWTIEAGNTLFVKKGAAIITQDFDDDFYMLGFFLPDDIIQESLSEVTLKTPTYNGNQVLQFTAAELKQSSYLEGFFQSMLTYFRGKEQPPDSIIKLKIKELLINIIYNCDDNLLLSYFKMLTENCHSCLTHIMESNFCYNLKMEEFAKMSHRSLSTFKRDFQNHYNMNPGKWLLSKRLDYAASLLLNNFSNISQIAFESGFEDVSHFSRAFKEKYSLTPSEYRKVS